jgi:hypothetical protein
MVFLVSHEEIAISSDIRSRKLRTFKRIAVLDEPTVRRVFEPFGRAKAMPEKAGLFREGFVLIAIVFSCLRIKTDFAFPPKGVGLAWPVVKLMRVRVVEGVFDRGKEFDRTKRIIGFDQDVPFGLFGNG